MRSQFRFHRAVCTGENLHRVTAPARIHPYYFQKPRNDWILIPYSSLLSSKRVFDVKMVHLVAVQIFGLSDEAGKPINFKQSLLQNDTTKKNALLHCDNPNSIPC